MPKQLLVRNVPDEVHHWIEVERQQRRMTQREFVLSILENASLAAQTLPLPFWQGLRNDPALRDLPFTFADLFAGIGGFRLALEAVGGRCVFSSEWDKYCQKTYRAWFGETPQGDITKIRPCDIPDHDILAAGFPCQPFSIAGVSKKKSLGRAHGFKCATQGTLFFTLASILEVKRPPVVFLENVKNLQSHDSGRTWLTIKNTLEALDYMVFHKIIDAAAWVPQHRERIYIVCFDRRVFGDAPPFTFPDVPRAGVLKLRDILEENPDEKYTLSEHLWNYLVGYARRHQEKGNGFGYGLADIDGVSRTLSARYFKDGSEILIPQEGKCPRRLTPRECARLMGFDDALPIVVSDTQAYRQFGNAVVPKVANAIAQEIIKVFRWQLAHQQNGCLLKSNPSIQLQAAPATA